MKPEIVLYVEPEECPLTRDEIVEMCEILAESYPVDGKYVASFGFLTYFIKRKGERCKVEVRGGSGYHNSWSVFDMNKS